MVSVAGNSSAAPSLEVNPATELQFVLTQDNTSTKATMTLRNVGGLTQDSLAFKIKTTQPRRYLVRPNQGLIPPGGTEDVQILLVDKDKAQLLQSYQRLGQSALDHCKDKFLVQSTVVTPQFCQDYASSSENAYDKLSALWAAVTSANSGNSIANKKLHVKHVVQEAGAVGAAAAAMPARHEASATNPAEMTQDQLLAEITNLRRKYDELVAFSVNLTAERDILNNTLEQTKRDLNREMLQKNNLMNQRGLSTSGSSAAGGAAQSGKSGGSSILRLFMSLILAVLAFGVGMKMENAGMTDQIKALPVVGDLITANGSVKPLTAAPVEPTIPRAEQNEEL